VNPPTNSKTAKAHKFLAPIYRMGINRAVNVPEKISRELDPGIYVPVIATVGGRSARTTLVPAGGGCYRLFLDSRLRSAAGADTGDVVGVMLQRDGASRELPVPNELRAALGRSAASRSAFREITPALRREFLRWVHAAKTMETRERRIQRGLRTLRERAAARRHSGARRKQDKMGPAR
jgi:hypothetical protein